MLRIEVKAHHPKESKAKTLFNSQVHVGGYSRCWAYFHAKILYIVPALSGP